MAAVFVNGQRIAGRQQAVPVLPALLFVCAFFAAGYGPRAASSRLSITTAHAQQSPTPTPTASVADFTEGGGNVRRNYLQAAFNKVRPGSFLKLEAPPQPATPELRGVLERRRDRLLRQHYARLAQLDALADEVGRKRDVRIAEQIETARRRDTQQFFLAMQALKVDTLAAWMAGSR